MPGMNPSGPISKVPSESASDAMASPLVLGVALDGAGEGRDVAGDGIAGRGGGVGGGGIGAWAGRGTTIDF